MIKEVGETVGSNASWTTNELIVVVSVHGPEKAEKEEITSAPDSGGGMPDALSSETVDGAAEAKVINGDNYSGGDDRDEVSANHSA